MVAIVCFYGPGKANDATPTVRGDVTVNTQTYRLHARLVYSFTTPDTSATVRFYLSSAANLRSLRSGQLKNYYIDTASKSARTLVLNFERPSSKADVHFEYDFTFDSAKFNKYGFIELGLDWFWFPAHTAMSGWKFTFDLDVSIDQENIDLFSNGQVKRSAKTSFVARSIYPDFDIDLFFLKNARVYPSGTVKVIGNERNSPLKDSVAVTTRQYLSYYDEKFGKAAGKVTCVFRPVPNDPNGFGYARKGYFVLPEPASLSSIKFYVAHELAHFWFLHGEPNENAWLTESLAEFAAMMLIRQLDGDSAYNAILHDKKTRMQRFQADGRVIPAVDKNGAKNKTMWSQVALYHKGPLVLEELRQRIGNIKMMQLLKEVAVNRTNTTAQFLDVLERLTDKATREMMLEKLRS